MLSIEEIKSLNMVEFLSSQYGLDFRRQGDSYVCLSPFNEEKEPSFKVRQLGDGHWLFKDFSSNRGGSLIDFVIEKEGFVRVEEGLRYINEIMTKGGERAGIAANKSSGGSNGEKKEGEVIRESRIDVGAIYRKLLSNEAGICKEYLMGRGIESEIIEELISRGLLVHNDFEGVSYCCFAVFDHNGELSCLDNHEIKGKRKFVLGKKSVFSLDWSEIKSGKPLGEIYVCEGVIDYLSLKSMLEKGMIGIALLGRSVNFDSWILESAEKIISALDADEGGLRGLLDLEEKYPGKEIEVYDMCGSKDANEYLQSRRERAGSGKLNGQDKLLLYKEFMVSENKLRLAKRWGINRSYMYKIVKECEEMIVNGFSQRQRGRGAKGEVGDLAGARERIRELEREKIRLETKNEENYARGEFLQVRLKWAEQEVLELRGESEGMSRNRKKHLKKKRKRS
jgi:DNA primase